MMVTKSVSGMGIDTSGGTPKPPADSLDALLEKIEHLNRAIVSSREIGAAVGILMARHGLTYEQGFDHLCRASQNSNQKLRDIAAQVLLTGRSPAVPPPRRG